MWFKQVQVFQLSDAIAYKPELLAEKMTPMAFTPCLPSFPISVGWASPLDEDGAHLVHAGSGYILLCMQAEEKILPASVIRQALLEKIKRIEKTQERKVRAKDKMALKDEVVMDLLPRAFTKLSRIYAYIDTKQQRLIIGTTQANKIDQFITLYKRSFTEGFHNPDFQKLSPLMTSWIKNQRALPSIFNIEEACVLQDPQQQARTIRCQHQDLFAASVQAFIKEGCEIKQLAMSWHDRVKFVLCDDMSLRSVQFLDEIVNAAKEMEAETKQQQLDADFFIMTQTFEALFEDLLPLLLRDEAKAKEAEPA